MRSTLAQGDVFVQKQQAEATQNASSGFSIAFSDDRRAFHPGETIKLVFTFHRYDVSPYNYEHCPGLGLADAVLDHSEGTVDPQADFWNNGIVITGCGVLSGVMGGIAADQEKVEPRIQFPVYLNQVVRFERPGKYRFYVRSRHGDIFKALGKREPPLISNILEFEIVSQDEAWETRTFDEAIRIIKASTDKAARVQAARAISYLGTAQAVDEMAQLWDTRSLKWGAPEDPDIALEAHWLRGLYGAMDRARVVQRMEQELDRPERNVLPRFVSHLALLDLTHRSQIRPVNETDYDSKVRAYSIRHLAALKRAGRLRTDLEQAFSDSTEHAVMAIAFTALVPGFAEFPGDVEAAFATLSPVQQRTFLVTRRNWTALHDPAFKPMLRRLSKRTDRDGPQDIALMILNDITTRKGRSPAGRAEGPRPEPLQDMPRIFARPSTFPGGEPTFFVRDKTYTTIDSREALNRQLSLYPRETVFTWQDREELGDEVWLPGEAAELFEQTRTFVQSRGMALIRR